MTGVQTCALPISGFCHNLWPVVLTVVSGRELPRLTRTIQEIDPDAFLVISRVSEVRGRGFTLGKVYRQESASGEEV